MAGEAQLLKEFLVSIGFKVDESSFNRFNGRVASATMQVAKLGAALAAMTTTAVLGITKLSQGFEELYYLSQRTNTAAANILSMAHAFGQVGLTAGDAKSALNNLALAMKLNPGVEGLLNALGIQTSGKDGPRDRRAIMTDLLQRLQKMPTFLAAQYGQMFGISPQTLLQLLQNLPDMLRSQERWDQMIKDTGANVDLATRKGRDWMNLIRDIGDAFDLIAMQITIAVIDKTEPILRRFRNFLIDNFKDITEAVGNFIVYTITGFEKYIEYLKWVYDKVDEYTNGMALLFFGLATAVAALGLASTLNPLGLFLLAVVAVATAIGYISTNWDKVKPSVDSALSYMQARLEAFKSWYDKSNIKPVLEFLSRSLGGFFGGFEGMESPRDTLNGLLHRQDYQTPSPGIGGGIIPIALTGGGGGGFSQPGDPSLPRGLRNNNPGNLRQWAGAGSDGSFAVFRSATEGLTAMRDNLLSYGRRGLTTIAQIINRWAPSNENNTNAYISMVARALGVDPNQPLNLGDSNTMSRLMAAMIQHENGYNPFSQEMLRGIAGGRAASAPSVVMNQNTNITVSGANDPSTVAATVAEEQRRVNADLLRNAQGAMVA